MEKKTSALWAVSLRTISLASFISSKSSLRSWGRPSHSSCHVLPWTYVTNQNNGEPGLGFISVILFNTSGLRNKTQPLVNLAQIWASASPSNWLLHTHLSYYAYLRAAPAASSESFVRTNIRLSCYPICLLTLTSSLYTFFLTLSSSLTTCTAWIRKTDKLENANLQEQQAVLDPIHPPD